MDIRQITWQQAIPIRQRVLWPEKPSEFCYVDGDDTAIHFGAFVSGILVCVASIYIEGNTARLRKYATELTFQGQGIGSAVLNEVITYLTAHKITNFWCDARASALSFYQRFGMVRQSERFYKSEVPYYKMAMALGFAENPPKTL